jgi:choline dehydrogenase-like flavoprotein
MMRVAESRPLRIGRVAITGSIYSDPQTHIETVLYGDAGDGISGLLGGAVIGPDRTQGVVDARQRVSGYENLLVVDGAAIPANVGVNPRLTITAMAEHAMSHVPSA